MESVTELGTAEPFERRNPLHDLLGGPRGALESALPGVVFVTAYLISGSGLDVALTVAVGTAIVLAGLRLLRREKPIRVLGGLAAVAVAALVAARTGNAADYFLPSLLANLASSLIWAVSVLAGWPLLGVVLGFALGQKAGWRSDPELVRAYGLASWVWAASFLVRAGVNIPLYLNDNLVGLGIARVLLGWPLVLLVMVTSWWVIRRTLPADHPGVMHPSQRRTAG